MRAAVRDWLELGFPDPGTVQGPLDSLTSQTLGSSSGAVQGTKPCWFLGLEVEQGSSRIDLGWPRGSSM